MSRTVLIVDDDPTHLHATSRLMEMADYSTLKASNANDTRQLITAHSPDMCIVDAVLPGTSGRVLCAEIAETSRAGIIVVSEEGSTEECARTLRLGADDFIVKPYAPEELVARVAAVVRRLHKHDAPRNDVSTVGNWRYICAESRLLFNDGRSVALTGSENRVLQHLLKNKDLVITREEILAVSRIRQHSGKTDRSVDMLIRRLRLKLEEDPDTPVLLRTVWGRGYRFALPHTQLLGPSPRGEGNRHVSSVTCAGS